MTITSNDPNIYAKAFSNSLSNRALEWYMTLPLKSIDSYQQTVDAFIAKFGSAIQKHQDERALLDIQQRPNETLKSYHKRYNDILLTIPVVNNKVVYMAFYRGLAYGKLKKDLVLETPLPKDDLTTRLEVYAQIEDKKLLPKPVRMRSAPGKRDRTCYCKYYHEHGHDTNECRVLDAEIEKIIKRGYLKEFMAKGTQRDNQRQNHRSPPPPQVKPEPAELPRLTGRIDTIFGGIAGGGDSRKERYIQSTEPLH
ncbi:hypothetical protein LIER_13455 [Lithospermum erythrorhizon]|uniref:Retrotransposon gag domain-containing protein n=1 Tax=Lithospermum erythrorhizon TaxID=34254 RepID=A0AAV3PVH5_LITER